MVNKQAQGRFEGFMYKVVQDEKGKIIQKTETWPREQNVFKYAYDTKGRLAKVYRNSRLVESYTYNYLGQMDRIRYEYQENGIMPVRIYCDNRLAWECRWRKNGAPQQMINRIQDTTYTWLYQDEDSYSSVCVFIEGDIIKKLGLASGTWGLKKNDFS